MKRLVLFFLLCSNALFAQLSDQQYFNTYQEAKKLFDNKEYDEAYTKLTPLTNRNYQNTVAPYAYLYAALSAENKGNKYQAKILYRSLIQHYSDWNKINDARILYAKSNLADGYFEEGLKALHEITENEYNDLKLGLIDEYIKNVKTVTALKNLYTKYPNYKPIAKALVDKIQSNRYNTKADLELSDVLTNRFNLIEQPSSPASPRKKENKKENLSQLNFGILLPFDSEKQEIPSTSNRYIYEIYAGMQLAAEKLSSDGINISVHAYDIKNDAQTFKKAEKKEGFDKLDVIVGPLYATPNNLVQPYVNDKNFIQVHPISNNITLLGNSKNSFLMQPSHAQQAKKSFDYIVSNGIHKSVSIYFGDARKDSLFAGIYATEAKKRGFAVTEIKRFSGQKLKPEKGHIFYAGDNNGGVKFLQGVAMNNLNCEVVVTASSFNWDRINTSIFTDKVALIYPEFVNRNKESVIEFEKNYFTKTSGVASYYSCLGFDLVYYFGSMLKDGRNVFKTNTELGEYIDNYMLSGYDFSGKVKQNEIVPIVKIKNSDFEEIYR